MQFKALVALVLAISAPINDAPIPLPALPPLPLPAPAPLPIPAPAPVPIPAPAPIPFPAPAPVPIPALPPVTPPVGPPIPLPALPPVPLPALPPIPLPALPPIPIPALPPISPRTPGPGQCNTSPIQCCDSVQRADSADASVLLALFGVVLQDLTIPIGLTCSPISVIGAPGNSCSSEPVCCEDNSFNGVIVVGCTPINVNLQTKVYGLS